MNAVWPESAAGAQLGLAVSGGGDSLALLLLANTALPGAVMAATVDHGLRAENAIEAAAVAAICQQLDVPHATLVVSVAGGNVSDAARNARYAALSGWMAEQGLTTLATAHHADDQAETLLLRLNRASGVAGLAGVRARGPMPGGKGIVIRPLLNWRRADLAAVVAAAGLVPADDPTNRNPAYDRARLRAQLADADWLDVAAIAASAGHLADADAALDWTATREWTENVRRDGLVTIYRPVAPRAIAMRVIARICREMGADSLRGGQIARGFAALRAGQTISLGGLVVRPRAAGWAFTPAPRPRSAR